MISSCEEQSLITKGQWPEKGLEEDKLGQDTQDS